MYPGKLGNQLELLEVIPDPTSLMESMRAVGYSVETAIADLVDNSISANASQIDIQYDASLEYPYIAILDNGHGMSADQLTNAMRHGSTNPTDKRSPEDLGRFGLGLKTASLSQCRKLTVLSKRDGVLSARRWDLDVVEDKGRWYVVVPGESELSTMPMWNRLQMLENGTLVIWQDLDRLMAGARDQQKEMTVRLRPLYEHLALVFHRFTRDEGKHKAIHITLNGLAIPERDPFLSRNHFRQPLEGQRIRYDLDGNAVYVNVQPVILPPISKLKPDEIELAGGSDGLRGTQGFYVYRNRRLVIWGTWFRLVPKQEFYKLTRVQVDIPNSFDALWALDIKKSAAYPPDIIRERLKSLIEHFAGFSKKTITYRGRRTGRQDYIPAWNRIEPGNGTFRYEINPEHVLIQSLANTLDAPGKRLFQSLLSLLAESLPLEGIYADMCGDQRPGPAEIKEKLLDLAREILSNAPSLDASQLLALDPFARHPDLHEEILEELQQ